MRYGQTALCAAFAIGSSFAHRVQAADPLGFYVGGALGLSTVRANEDVFGNPLEFNKRDNAWELLVGLRPISLIGAELDYMDFGHPHTSVSAAFGLGFRTDVHPMAAALFGVLYAPIPIPLLDIYGKAGVARLQSTVNVSEFCATPPCPGLTGVAPYHLNQTETRPAYGVGAQFRFAAFGARLEYERISANGGDPDVVSLGITWNF
jgi:hypothetical protein